MSTVDLSYSLNVAQYDIWIAAAKERTDLTEDDAVFLSRVEARMATHDGEDPWSPKVTTWNRLQTLAGA